MKTINSQNKRSPGDETSQARAAAVLTLLSRLETALEEEGEAIIRMDEGCLHRVGLTIQRQLELLAEMLAPAAGFSPLPSEKLLPALNRVKGKREANHRFAEKTILGTGRAVKKAAAGRQALSAYHPPGNHEELFIKIKC